MAYVSVDLSDPRNRSPEPQLDDSEFIECFTVRLNELPDRLRELAKQGYKLDGRIQSMADGIEIAKTYSL
jgi:ADP-ribose pyrophosphatase